MNNIYSALQQLFQKTLQANNHINGRLHLNAHINITTLALLSTRNRAKKSQCAHAE